MLYYLHGKSEHIKAAYPPVGGANPPDERKEGDADERYILGFNPVDDIHCRSCWSLL